MCLIFTNQAMFQWPLLRCNLHLRSSCTKHPLLLSRFCLRHYPCLRSLKLFTQFNGLSCSGFSFETPFVFLWFFSNISLLNKFLVIELTSEKAWIPYRKVFLLWLLFNVLALNISKLESKSKMCVRKNPIVRNNWHGKSSPQVCMYLPWC